MQKFPFCGAVFNWSKRMQNGSFPKFNKSSMIGYVGQFSKLAQFLATKTVILRWLVKLYLYIFAPMQPFLFTNFCKNGINKNTQTLCFSCSSGSHHCFLQHIRYITQKHLQISHFISKHLICPIVPSQGKQTKRCPKLAQFRTQLKQLLKLCYVSTINM